MLDIASEAVRNEVMSTCPAYEAIFATATSGRNFPRSVSYKGRSQVGAPSDPSARHTEMNSVKSSVSLAATSPKHGSLLELLEIVKMDLWTARAIWSELLSTTAPALVTTDFRPLLSRVPSVGCL